MPDGDEMAFLNCRVPTRLLLRLDAVAESEDRSRSSVVRRTLEAALNGGLAEVAPPGAAGESPASPRAPGLLERTEKAKTQAELDREYVERRNRRR